MTTQRPLYQRFAWAFDYVVPDASAGRVRRLASLLRRHDVRPPARILDAGCGTGNYARALARCGYTVVAIDPSMALRATARAPRTRDGASGVSARGSADVSPRSRLRRRALRGVLNDVLGDRARQAVCSTLGRALVPGGILLINVRDWMRTAVRKHAEPVIERAARADRGLLAFRSHTRPDPMRRRLVVREQIRLTSARRDIAVANRVVMSCWTTAELRRRLRPAGVARVRLLPPSRVGLSRDRLFAIATR
jgi:SAM-dependent methyltransferase